MTSATLGRKGDPHNEGMHVRSYQAAAVGFE
jgi:hypothetical protein